MENVCVDAIIIVKLLKIVLLKDYYSFDQSKFISFTLVYVLSPLAFTSELEPDI